MFSLRRRERLAAANDEDWSNKLSGNPDVKPEENGLEWWQQTIINSLWKPMDSGYTRRTDF